MLLYFEVQIMDVGRNKLSENDMYVAVRSFHGFVQDIFIAVRSKIRRIKGEQSKK